MPADDMSQECRLRSHISLLEDSLATAKSQLDAIEDTLREYSRLVGIYLGQDGGQESLSAATTAFIVDWITFQDRVRKGGDASSPPMNPASSPTEGTGSGLTVDTCLQEYQRQLKGVDESICAAADDLLANRFWESYSFKACGLLSRLFHSLKEYRLARTGLRKRRSAGVLRSKGRSAQDDDVRPETEDFAETVPASKFMERQHDAKEEEDAKPAPAISPDEQFIATSATSPWSSMSSMSTTQNVRPDAVSFVNPPNNERTSHENGCTPAGLGGRRPGVLRSPSITSVGSSGTIRTDIGTPTSRERPRRVSFHSAGDRPDPQRTTPRRLSGADNPPPALMSPRSPPGDGAHIVPPKTSPITPVPPDPAEGRSRAGSLGAPAISCRPSSPSVPRLGGFDASPRTLGRSSSLGSLLTEQTAWDSDDDESTTDTPSHEVKETTELRKEKDDEGNKYINQYFVVQELGRGAFGKVKLAQHIENEKLYAIKILNKSLLGKVRRNGKNALQLAQQEVAILKKLRHKNIVSLYEVIDDEESDKLYMVLEYAEGGCAMRLQKDGTVEGDTFPETMARKFFRDLLSALRYSHRNNIVHRDIKPENLLLDGEGNLKLTDFGVSAMIESNDDELTDMEGTPAFLPPEALDPDKSAFSGKAADVWALGVTLYTFIFGRLPFFGVGRRETNEAILNEEPKIPETTGCGEPVEGELEDLLLQMLEKDPVNRVSLDALTVHPWVSPTRGLNDPLTPLNGSCRASGRVSPPGQHESAFSLGKPATPTSRRSDSASPRSRSSSLVAVTDDDIQRAILRGRNITLKEKFMVIANLKRRMSFKAVAARRRLGSGISDGLPTPRLSTPAPVAGLVALAAASAAAAVSPGKSVAEIGTQTEGPFHLTLNMDLINAGEGVLGATVNSYTTLSSLSEHSPSKRKTGKEKKRKSKRPAPLSAVQPTEDPPRNLWQRSHTPQPQETGKSGRPRSVSASSTGDGRPNSAPSSPTQSGLKAPAEVPAIQEARGRFTRPAYRMRSSTVCSNGTSLENSGKLFSSLHRGSPGPISPLSSCSWQSSVQFAAHLVSPIADESIDSASVPGPALSPGLFQSSSSPTLSIKGNPKKGGKRRKTLLPLTDNFCGTPIEPPRPAEWKATPADTTLEPLPVALKPIEPKMSPSGRSSNTPRLAPIISSNGPSPRRRTQTLFGPNALKTMTEGSPASSPVGLARQLSSKSLSASPANSNLSGGSSLFAPSPLSRSSSPRRRASTTIQTRRVKISDNVEFEEDEEDNPVFSSTCPPSPSNPTPAAAFDGYASALSSDPARSTLSCSSIS